MIVNLDNVTCELMRKMPVSVIPDEITEDKLRPSFRILVWVNIAIQACFPLACAFTPVMAASAEKNMTTPPEHYRHPALHLTERGDGRDGRRAGKTDGA